MLNPCNDICDATTHVVMIIQDFYKIECLLRPLLTMVAKAIWTTPHLYLPHRLHIWVAGIWRTQHHDSLMIIRNAPFWPTGSCRNPGSRWTNQPCHRPLSGRSLLRLSQGFNTARVIGIVFLTNLIQAPLISPDASKPSDLSFVAFSDSGTRP